MHSVNNYFQRVADLLPRIPAEPVEQIIGVLRDAQANGRRIFMFANGGSSANASHLVNDFVKSVRVPGRPRMRVFCLSDNTPLLTALANDSATTSSSPIRWPRWPSRAMWRLR